MCRAVLVAFGVLALVLAAPARASAEDPVRLAVTQLDASQFPAVRIAASVTDAQGRAVKGLRAADLRVSEDGRPQKTTVTLTDRVAPVALVLVLDTSGSIAGQPFSDAKAAMNSLVRSLGPADRGAVVTFNTTASVAQPLTGDKNALAGAIDRAVAAGNTAIFDAVNAALDVVASVPAASRKAIVLLTDGIDNSSTTPLAALTQKLGSTDVPLYVVGLGADLDRPVLQRLADSSRNGAAYVAPTSSQLAAIYDALVEQIATEYSVDYTSDVRDAPAGTALAVTLQVVRSATVVGTATVTFTVPAGRDVRPPPMPTAEPQPRPGAVAAVPVPLSPYDAIIVGVLGGLSMLMLLAWALVVSLHQSVSRRERRRMARLLNAPADPGQAPTLRRPFRTRVMAPVLQRLARPFLRFVPSPERLRDRLAQAGNPFDLTTAEFIGVRLLTGLLCAIVTLAVAAVFRVDLLLFLLASLFGLLLGYALPGILLGRAIRARQRQIVRALPAALDMLALSATAGLTFDGAIAQVVERWQTPFSEELRRLLVEFRMGSDRRTALRGLARRVGLIDVTRFSNAIIQADSLGVPISKVLIEQAIEMRTRRRQRAEEAARKAPIKMLFPMVGLIFPALFVVILGPAVPGLLDIFGAAR